MKSSTWVSSADVVFPWDGSVPITTLVPVFDLDGFRYYYDSRTGVYHAVKPRYVQGEEVSYTRYSTVQKHAAFSVDKDFYFVKPIGPPGLEVRLLAMKHAIEVHQIMES